MSLGQGAKYRNGGFPEVSMLYNLTASLPQPEKSGLMNSREFKMVRVCFKERKLQLTREQNGFELFGSIKTHVFSIGNAVALHDHGWLNLWMWVLRYKYVEWIRRADSNNKLYADF